MRGNAQPHFCFSGVYENSCGYRIYFFQGATPRQTSSNRILNVSRVSPRDLEPVRGDFDSAKDAVLRTNSKNESYSHNYFI